MKNIHKITTVISILLITSLIFSSGKGQIKNRRHTPKEPELSVNTSSGISGKLLIEGSTSMQKMFLGLADAYMEMNKNVVVEYIGDGSSAGIKAVIEGRANIGTASRNIEKEELSRGLEVITIAQDAIAVIVHPDNIVTNLSKQQIAKIYKKELVNWKDVGGRTNPIVVVARDPASGTRKAFESVFGIQDSVMADQEAAKNGEVLTVVSQNPNAIGYVSLSYVKGRVKTLMLDNVKASPENVLNDTYIVKRPFNIVTKGKPDKLEKNFIDFIFTDKGRAIIEKEAIPVER